MKVITENKVIQLEKEGVKSITIYKNTVITPSAWERLNSKGFDIIKVDDLYKEDAKPKKLINNKQDSSENKTDKKKSFNIDENEIDNIKENNERYICGVTGGYFDEKPEYMTHIRSNVLVYKNHERIIFRGKIDTLISEVLIMMSRANKENKVNLVSDLGTIKNFLRQLQYAEVSEKVLSDISFLSLTSAEIRDHSHHPMKYYNTEHLFNMDYDENCIAIELSLLRAHARELEISAFNAYFKDNNIERKDIMESLNRLSSVFYIMELRAVIGNYD